MKRKFRTTLFLVVLFVLTATSLFADPPVLTSENISAVSESGLLTIGSTITITATDVNNITNPDLQFQGAKVDLTQLELEKRSISGADAPLYFIAGSLIIFAGIWGAIIYVILLVFKIKKSATQTN